MSFFENTRKPAGFSGRVMVSMMNLCHSPMARWGFRFLKLRNGLYLPVTRRCWTAAAAAEPT